MSEANAEDGLRSHGRNTSREMTETILKLNLIFLYSVRPEFPQNKKRSKWKIPPPTLLFHLRHPNSKTNQPKFWQILSPKNSFCKTSSALFRHLPETLRAEHQRKMSFPFSRKISPPPRESCKEHFSLVLPSEARRWRNDSFHIGILAKKRILKLDYGTTGRTSLRKRKIPAHRARIFLWLGVVDDVRKEITHKKT